MTQLNVSRQPNIGEQLAGLSPAQRKLLELRLMKKNRGATRQVVIPRDPKRDTAPLSFNQQGLWLLHQLMAGETLYHTASAERLTGPLDVAALRKALQSIVLRHEALRTNFRIVDGTPQQFVRGFDLDVPLIDLTENPKRDQEAEALRLLQEEACRPFDLMNDLLVRALLVRLEEHEHLMLITMHHIATDGWSMGIFNRELSEFYEAYATGRDPALSELPIQYADYAAWQREWLSGERYEAQRDYWKKQFATLPPALELPTDHPRTSVPAASASRAAHHTLSLSPELTTRLKQLCQTEKVTLFMMLMAAFNVLLHRYTGEADIVVGTPIAGRQQPETEALIGLFINTLALRTNVAAELPFRELLTRVKQAAVGAYAHADLPFERLVKEVQPDRVPGQNPLFQVMFVLQSGENVPLSLPELTVEHLRIENPLAKFDLLLDVAERGDTLACRFESNAELFEPETIERLMGHFQTLLEAIVANPAQRVCELPLLTAAERRQLLVEWNDTATDYPSQSCIQELFEQQAASAPNATALVWDEGSMMYAELSLRANRLANYLRARGVGADTRVGVCMNRSPEMIVAILAILKAGGAYVPLDPTYPEARLQFMIEDSRAAVILTERSLLANLQIETEVVRIDEAADELAIQSDSNPSLTTNADNLACVIYTSGSTGIPKGVAATHRNIVRLVRNTNYASFSADQVFLQSSTISFDASSFEIWGSLLNGARLVVPPAGTPSLQDLGATIKRHGVTTLWLTAGLFHLMVENHLDDLLGVRQLLAGGDVLSVPHVQKVVRELPDCRLINGYGPTESTTFACCYPVYDLSKVNSSVPIGFPISNTTVYILDQHMNPTPIGVPGELYIGGDGLARGYLDRPELTRERFVANPFSSKSGDRLYRTGDLVRYKSSGEIEFLGRIDNQVKVRGFRIELGEIEAALVEHRDVRQAAVVACKDNGDKHLAAFLVQRNGHLETDEVREYLKQRLPDYMVPSVFVKLPALPLSPTGKVDRRALASIKTFNREVEDAFAAPADELELKLSKIWEQVLKVSPISVRDNFFDLGGHSLLAVRLFVEIEKAFGRNLPLATLFQAPTIERLARALRDDGWQPAWSSLVMIQPGAAGAKPFFCVHAVGGNVLEYLDLARLLGPDQPVYGLQAKGLDGTSAPLTSIKEMAAHYIAEIREVQPAGPYLLCGRSSGGLTAFEMACQLEAAGEQVAVLALLDTYPAGYFKLLKNSRTLNGRAARIAQKCRAHVRNLAKLDSGDKLRYVGRKLGYVPAKAKHRLYRRAYKLYQKFGKPLPPVLQNIEEINFAAVKDYEPQIYSGDVALFLASDLTASYDLHDGWRELVRGQIVTHEISGDHMNIVKEPHVGEVAEKLRTMLAEFVN
jgi:aspartate racemase